MSGEYLRYEQQVDELNEALNKNPHDMHLLLQTAYLSEKKRWLGSLVELEDNIKEAKQKIDTIMESQKNPTFLTNLWNKITNKDKLMQDNLTSLGVEVEHLKLVHEKMSDTPPNKDMYSLAFLGSNIFSVK